VLSGYLLGGELLEIRICEYNTLRYYNESNAFPDNIYLTLFDLFI
jgi:hypothetical protein